MTHKFLLCCNACLLVMALLLASGCQDLVEGAAEPEQRTAKPRVFLTPVQAAAPRRGAIASFFETTSRVMAESRVEVLSRGSGQCLSVAAEVGDPVDKGAVLAQLEREELEARLRQARVTARQRRAAFEIAEQSYQEGIGAAVDRDNAHFAYEESQAALELAEIQLRNQTVRAPIDGVVTQRLIQPGMVVSPGIPVFTIVDPDSFCLPVNAPEKELSRLVGGQEARVRIDAFPEREFIARIRRIDPSMDPASGTVRVVLDFDVEDRPLLREAAFARVRLVMETRDNALLAPREAVLEEQGRSFVYLLEAADKDDETLEEASEDKPVYIARRREVVTGLEQGEQVEIREGIPEDALIVVMGQHSLRPDAYVVVTNLEEELAARRDMTLDEALDAAKSSPGAAPSADRARRARVETVL